LSKSSFIIFSLKSLSSFLNVNFPMTEIKKSHPGVQKRPELDYLCFTVFSLETVSFLRPFFLRFASTRRPLAVAILSRNPCLFFLFLREG
jgi:hypothetical protein